MTTMRTLLILFPLLTGSAFAAPAIVWKTQQSSSNKFVHTSDDVKVEDLLSEVLSAEEESSLATVVFLLGRGQGGSESLTTMAQTGRLPKVAAKYEDAVNIHHHVSGVQSGVSMVSDASRFGHVSPLLVDLGEFSNKLQMMDEERVVAEEMEVGTSGMVVPKTVKHRNKRTKALAEANVLVVNVDPANTGPAEIDAAVVSAIEHAKVGNVVLSAIRSVDEVKHERVQAERRRLEIMRKAGSRMTSQQQSSRRRRLEDQQQQQEGGEQGQQEGQQQQNNNNDEDLTGVYYVYMTPNILAGVLFFLLFTTVTWIGVSCMGMIAGQDTYVKKMPTIGREA